MYTFWSLKMTKVLKSLCDVLAYYISASFFVYPFSFCKKDTSRITVPHNYFVCVNLRHKIENFSSSKPGGCWNISPFSAISILWLFLTDWVYIDWRFDSKWQVILLGPFNARNLVKIDQSHFTKRREKMPTIIWYYKTTPALFWKTLPLT